MLWLQSAWLLFWRSHSNPSSHFLANLDPAVTEAVLLQDRLVTLIKAAVKRLSVSSTLIKLQKSATSHPLVQVSRGPFAWTETFC